MDKHCPIDLLALRNVVGLCSFAAEAQRTLIDIDHLCAVFPEVEKTMHNHVEARRQWAEIPLPLAEVLGDVWKQIDAMCEWHDSEEPSAP